MKRRASPGGAPDRCGIGLIPRGLVCPNLLVLQSNRIQQFGGPLQEDQEEVLQGAQHVRHKYPQDYHYGRQTYGLKHGGLVQKMFYGADHLPLALSLSSCK